MISVSDSTTSKATTCIKKCTVYPTTVSLISTLMNLKLTLTYILNENILKPLKIDKEITPIFEKVIGVNSKFFIGTRFSFD